MLYHVAGKTISIYKVAYLFGVAYDLAFTPCNIKKGFKVTGIYPFDRNVFSEDEFLSSSVTDRPQANNDTNNDSTTSMETSIEIQQAPVSLQKDSMDIDDFPLSQRLVMPSEIRPPPKAPPRQSSNRRKKTSMILTNSPIKNDICSQIKQRQSKKEEAAKKKKMREDKKLDELVTRRAKALKSDEGKEKTETIREKKTKSSAIAKK